MKTMLSAILLSGEIGSRMNQAIPKQYMLLGGKPIIMHTLERLDAIDRICDIIIVCTDEYRPVIHQMVRQYGIHKQIRYATAGQSRQESVQSGLAYVKTDLVLIHEAARPFVRTEDFNQLINMRGRNVIIASPINYTVLKGQEYVIGLLDRSELINVQLPQKFDTALLKKAHEFALAEKRSFTEDASLLFYYIPNIEINILAGTEYNIKITTPIDIIIGRIIYREYFQRRV